MLLFVNEPLFLCNTLPLNFISNENSTADSNSCYMF
jgi:hypothetical protein